MSLTQRWALFVWTKDKGWQFWCRYWEVVNEPEENATGTGYVGDYAELDNAILAYKRREGGE